MSVPIKVLIKDIIDLLQKRAILIGVFFVYNFALFFYGNEQIRHYLMGDLDPDNLFVIQSLISMSVVTLLGFVLMGYLILHLMDDRELDPINLKKLILTIKQLPNMIITLLFTIIRMLPFLLLLILLLTIIVMILSLTMYGSRSFYMIITNLGFFPLFMLVFARFSLVFYTSITTRYKYWSSTQKGVELFKHNRKNVYFLSGIVLVGMLIPACTPFFDKAALPGEIYNNTNSAQYLYIISSLAGIVSILGSVVIIKRNIPKEDFILE
ncbi:hypothetical protein [Spirochaeta cellobiosiphila]|uniref:hypothetical protein n=1 Tax=Spirochaeta cellobiosiphila TaxID=504483 RepID=UPI0004027F1C|nr:hypothetical protein [Spirochaeta cellobiosiphila]